MTSEEVSEEKSQPFEKLGVEMIRVPRAKTGLSIEATLNALYKHGITHLLVEGGGNVNASFLRRIH